MAVLTVQQVRDVVAEVRHPEEAQVVIRQGPHLIPARTAVINGDGALEIEIDAPA